MEEKKAGKNESFFKRHKKAIIVGSVVISVTIAGVIFLYKNPENVEIITKLLKSNKLAKANESEDVVLEVISTEATNSTTQMSVTDTALAQIAQHTENVRSYTSPQVPYPVRNHPMKLAPGKTPSAKAIQNAIDAGITLQPGETFRSTYIKYANQVA